MNGLTLRDYFAAKAAASFIAATAGSKIIYSADIIALHAYNVADAMLKEREKGADNA